MFLARLLWICLLVVLIATPVVAQDASSTDEPGPPSWQMSNRQPGEPYFAPLLRTRAEESTYRDSQWWAAYNQLRAQAEAAAGNHAAALAAWDAMRSPRDTVGVLPEGIHAVSALEYLAGVADTARVIMINERHHAASDRLLTLALLEPLYAKGYRYLAAEAFSDSDSLLNARAYPVEDTGVYTAEPVFAEVVREARRLGYTLVPYEQMAGQGEEESDLTPQQRRDRAQAQNLDERIFRRDPEAKVLVHAGYSHVLEQTSERWYPMAVYFRETTGIDPVTVDQTRLSERSAPGFEHPHYRAAVADGLAGSEPVVLLDDRGLPYCPASFAVDVQVFSPRTTYSEGRPDWMTLGGRRTGVEIELPEGGADTCFVEARAAGEPPEAIPLDRAEVDGSGAARLFLPIGQAVVIHVFGKAGELLRQFEYAAEAPGVD